MASNIFFAVQCSNPGYEYEHNVFITLEGKITDSSNQEISGLDLVLGQVSDDWEFRKKHLGFEFDSLENVFSRRVKIGMTDESGNFKFVVPSIKGVDFLIYNDSKTMFRYIDDGYWVDRNYILFERDKLSGRFSNEIKNIQIVDP